MYDVPSTNDLKGVLIPAYLSNTNRLCTQKVRAWHSYIVKQAFSNPKQPVLVVADIPPGTSWFTSPAVPTHCVICKIASRPVSSQKVMNMAQSLIARRWPAQGHLNFNRTYCEVCTEVRESVSFILSSLHLPVQRGTGLEVVLSEMAKQLDERREYVEMNKKLSASLAVLTAVVDLRKNDSEKEKKTRWTLSWKKKKQGSKLKSPWSCHVCTFTNVPERVSCEMCDTFRDTSFELL